MGILEVDSVKKFDPKIIKVPVDIRKDHDDAYEPKHLFIGPYHRKHSPMEEVKLLYLKNLLFRDVQHNLLSNYIKEICNDAGMARMKYSDTIELSNEDFVEMLVVDGCFIIEFLLKCADGNSENDPAIFSRMRTCPTQRLDLLLLENQIPFFVLEKILQMSNYDVPNFPKRTTTLIDFALHYLTNGSLTKDRLCKVHQEEKNIYHLLHLSYLCLMAGLSPLPIRNIALTRFQIFYKKLSFIRYFFIFFFYCMAHLLVLLFLWKKHSWFVPSELKSRMLPTATELKEASVTFEKDSNCYIDVSFDKEGYIKIPFPSIQANTNSEFRNFLAFEQSCPEVGSNFTSYVVLMDSLIDTSSDVAILKRKGVLENTLGSDDEVARLFNQMRFGLCFNFDNHYLDKMFQHVNKYCNRLLSRWRAKLMHDYFGNRWAYTAVIAFLAFTILLRG